GGAPGGIIRLRCCPRVWFLLALPLRGFALLPYTTLFRSLVLRVQRAQPCGGGGGLAPSARCTEHGDRWQRGEACRRAGGRHEGVRDARQAQAVSPGLLHPTTSSAAPPGPAGPIPAAGQVWIMIRRTLASASFRFETSSLRYTERMCVLTVFTDSPRECAIPTGPACSSSACSTCASRTVRVTSGMSSSIWPSDPVGAAKSGQSARVASSPPASAVNGYCCISTRPRRCPVCRARLIAARNASLAAAKCPERSCDAAITACASSTYRPEAALECSAVRAASIASG